MLPISSIPPEIASTRRLEKEMTNKLKNILFIIIVSCIIQHHNGYLEHEQ